MVEHGTTGLIVGPGDVTGLADGIVRLATDSDLRRRFGAAGAGRAQRDFSLDAHLDAVERVLVETAALPKTASVGG